MKEKSAIWKDRNFIKYFSANLLSNLGNWFDFVAVLILFRYTWEAEPMLIALIPVMYAIPSILLGQFAGVFADRRNKLKILVHSDWIRAGLTFLLVFTGSPMFALPVLLLRNTVGVISLPAQQGLMRSIVEEEDLMKAVTINGSLFQLVKVVGPLLGGSVAGALSPQFSIAINAFSFLLSGVILTRVSVKHRQPTGEEEEAASEKSGFLASWKEGWTFVIHSRILFASILFGIVSTLVIQMIDAQLVTLFSEVFPERAGVTGWVISAIGVGSLLMVVLLNKLEKIQKYGWFFGAGSLLIGIMTGGFGYLSEYNFIAAAIGFALIGGIGNGLVFTAIQYLIQKEPPKEAIGRVSGIIDSTLSLLFIIGPLLGGLVISQLGVLYAFRVIGAGLAMIGLLGILLQKFIWKSKGRHVFHQETLKSKEKISVNESYPG
ncbi:MFS transporter [Salimicrobium halophilum]|uniref:Major Facilitator Superfamily protein n=1 Tax=Salimicrobium halophilum TaxID=86666 RepID=A0A1G8QWV5_9BACI|nr:MFS transporter [Salimicrobium halophilum]SDJ09151.1 Major Facilitator Superfamily protein [Salimicrobium halophilum]